MAQNILIVDDEPDIRDLLEITLIRMGHQTQTAENLRAARDALAAHTFDLCLTDMNLPDGNGIDLVRHIQKHHPNTPVAVITAYGSVDTAIAALKAGAFDFVSKPVELSRLRELVTTALKLSAGKTDNRDLKRELLGTSPAMSTLRRQIRKLARSQAPIYISGESGSGKELVARMIHSQGPRADGPFIPVNCGAIPSELMESEFFGHRKGAFTGATDNKTGLFQAASGGTLFLDEVADLPLPMQVKLLRAIQEKAVRPVGDEQEYPVDVRILAATHKNLQNEVAEGRFRQDLFYRINVIELKVPPLRERKEDIPLLARHILDKLSAECDLPPMGISRAALDKLLAYSFPGNVRELENILERAFTLCEGEEIGPDDLALEPAPAGTTTDDSGHSQVLGATPEIPVNLNLEDFLESIEKKAIEKALEETRWNKTAAAKKLGISFRALRYRLKKLGME